MVGDFILVNKFTYGIRLPIVEQKVVPIADPQRGDVVVFRYPVNPSQDFIKRVVGVGGDEVVYRDKKLTVNGKPLPQTRGRHLQLPRGPALRDDRAAASRPPTPATAPRTYTIARQPAGGARLSAERAAVPGPRELRLQ